MLVHLWLAVSALLSGSLIGFAAGYAAYRQPLRASGILSVLSAMRVIPSIALLVVFIPWLGIGFVPAWIALSVLAAAPIALAVENGLTGVAPTLLECARAIGMDDARMRARIVWPLASPIILAGIRTAAVEVIASASLAAFVGAGGLGEYIVEGLADGNPQTLAMGAVTIALLAWIAEYSFAVLGGALARRYAVAYTSV